jgi:hypothetical protein
MDEPEPQFGGHQIFTSRDYGTRPAERTALSCSREIPDARGAGDLKGARNLALWVAKLDENYFDLLFYLTNEIDTDTSICGYRGLIAASQPLYEPAFPESADPCCTSMRTRPYVRVLLGMASAPKRAERLDRATYSYEELLSLNRDDYS